MDGHSHILIRASLHLSAGVLVESEQVKPVCVSVNGWYGMSVTLHILRKCKSICHVCVWHPATCHFPWVDSVVDRQITAPAGLSLSHTESSQWTSTALHLFVQGNTHMFCVRPHVSYTLQPRDANSTSETWCYVQMWFQRASGDG